MRRAGGGGLLIGALLGAAPATGAPQAAQTIPAQAQVATFLHKLEAGDLSGALAALPRGVRLGHARTPQPMTWIRAVTEGCTHHRIGVTTFRWLTPPRTPRPPGRPSRLRPGAMVFLGGAPPPNAEDMALSVFWDCPPEMRDIVLHFYLVDDRIVRVGYVLPPVVAP